MLSLQTKTKLKPEEVIKLANSYFQGFKLNIVDKSLNCVTYEGGGGGVSITTSSKEGITIVDLESREWDYQIKNFIYTLPKKVLDKNKDSK
jgi:hypothetical protein